MAQEKGKDRDNKKDWEGEQPQDKEVTSEKEEEEMDETL